MKRVLILILAVLLGACASQGQVVVMTATSPPETETPIPPTETPVPSPTNTPLPTPTPKPRWDPVSIGELEEALRETGYRRYPFTTGDGLSAFDWVKESAYEKVTTWEDGRFELQVLHDESPSVRGEQMEKKFKVLDQVMPAGFMAELRDQNASYNRSVRAQVSGEPEQRYAYGDEWQTVWAEYYVENTTIGSYDVWFSVWWWQSTCPSQYGCYYTNFPGLDFFGDSSFTFYTIYFEPITSSFGPTSATVKVCQVTDTGGIDDKSFNATAWKGVEDAVAQLDVEGKYLESQQQTDYERNINAFIEEDCDLIVTVGFLLGDATAAAAETNPNQKFSIVDYAYDPAYPNVIGQVFNTQEAAFLAGYVAAGVTKTGVIGTFGGIQIPPVTVFMDGFYLGAMYYNEVHGTSVKLLGWDPAIQTGLFTGNFESLEDGRNLGESLIDEGADIIMPVAGPVGLGTAAAAKARSGTYIVGVDNDWAIVNSTYAPITLTSVLKNMDSTTFNVIKSVIDGTFAGGVTVGTLENGGVGLASFHNLDGMVSADLKAELDDVSAKLISGELSANP
jgi:basic membrane protein A